MPSLVTEAVQDAKDIQNTIRRKMERDILDKSAKKIEAVTNKILAEADMGFEDDSELQDEDFFADMDAEMGMDGMDDVGTRPIDPIVDTLPQSMTDGEAGCNCPEEGAETSMDLDQVVLDFDSLDKAIEEEEFSLESLEEELIGELSEDFVSSRIAEGVEESQEEVVEESQEEVVEESKEEVVEESDETPVKEACEDKNEFATLKESDISNLVRLIMEKINFKIEPTPHGHIGRPNAVELKKWENIFAAVDALNGDKEEAGKERETIKESISQSKKDQKLLEGKVAVLEKELKKSKESFRASLEKANKVVQESVMINRKLLVENKILRNENLSNKQKNSIVTSIHEAESLNEVESLYKSAVVLSESTESATPRFGHQNNQVFKSMNQTVLNENTEGNKTDKQDLKDVAERSRIRELAGIKSGN